MFALGYWARQRGGADGEVRAAIEHADCLIGAARMPEVAARPGQLRVAAIAPDAIAAAIAAHPECSNLRS